MNGKCHFSTLKKVKARLRRIVLEIVIELFTGLNELSKITSVIETRVTFTCEIDLILNRYHFLFLYFPCNFIGSFKKIRSLIAWLFCFFAPLRCHFEIKELWSVTKFNFSVNEITRIMLLSGHFACNQTKIKPGLLRNNWRCFIFQTTRVPCKNRTKGTISTN